MPVPVPPNLLPRPSMIVSSSITFRRNGPLPVPVLIVTVQVVHELLAAATKAPEMPVVVRLKSVLSTPVTDFENVTVKLTLKALVGLKDARVMLITSSASYIGGVFSEK